MISLLTHSFVLFNLIVGEPETCDLRVRVSNIESDKGKIAVAIFDNEENFLKKDFTNISIAVDSSDYIIFKGIPQGKYAVSIFHDENENGELDTNWLGVPTEKFGFSNNKLGMFGPPNFKDCLVHINDENEEIIIELKKIL